MKIPMIDIKESLNELYEKLHKERDAEVKRRIYMLVLIKEGKARTRKAVAKRIGVHRNTIRDWLSKYETGGLGALVQIKSPGAPPGQRSLSDEVLAFLKKRLAESTGFASYVQIQRWLEGTYDFFIKYKTLHRIIRYELKAKLKIPRRSHEKKNDAEQAAFREELPDKLKTLASERYVQNIRVLTQDESRLGLMPVTKRRITAKGVKPIQKIQFQFESYYLYGAVEPLTGDVFYLEMPGLNSTCFQLYLDELSQYFKEYFLIILTDNSSAHKAKGLIIPDNMVFLPFPSYCPELNPIERLWQYIKSKIDFTLIKTMEGLKLRVSDILKKECTESVVASITGYSYIIDAVMALTHS
jgi:putative transposase